IVLLLQSHGQLTAAQLAELLETSERTIRRDLEALSISGVPVYSQRGRGGGWALLGGHRLDLTGFTIEEAQALFLVAGAHAKSPSGVEPVVRSALRKVLNALPEPLRVHAAAATQASVVDPSGWGGAPDDAQFLSELRGAVIAKVQVEIDYAKPGGAPENRRVHPYGLVSKGGTWYLLAGTAHGRRTFRVSRVQAVRTTEDPVDLPEGFDLSDEWASAQHDFFSRMRVVEVELDVAEHRVLALSATLRGWATIEERAGSSPGWRRLSVWVPHTRAAAVQLAPFGGDVRVISPAELREELARIGHELIDLNSPQ
ncbi:MAG: helix-turn-helix transcriptional regulator, partial [Acidimicrobiales bacterium]